MLKKITLGVLVALLAAILYNFSADYPISRPLPAGKTPCVPNPPDYIYPMVNLGSATISNAFLIDNKFGLLLTAAHTVTGRKNNIEESIYIQTAQLEFLLARTREEWTDWQNDIAILQIENNSYPLPEPGRLSKTVSLSQNVVAVGFLPNFAKYETPDELFVSFCIDAEVLKINTMRCVFTLFSKCMGWYTFKIFTPRSNPPEKARLGLSSRGFTRITKHKGSSDFRLGMSGAPVIKETGEIIGIISAIGGHKRYANTAFLASAADAEKLVFKAKLDLKKESQ